MHSLIFYLGTLYILIGIIFLSVPIIYLELGKPKDLIKSFLNLLIGLILIIKNKVIDESFFIIFLLLTVLVIFYLVEVFFTRWYQLTDIEKKKLTTFLEFKKNSLKIFEAMNLGFGNYMNLSNFFNFGSNNKKSTQKKWVRNDKNDNMKV